MLVPFVIDADSLEPDPAWSAATLRACHADLLDLWNRVGLLVHDGAGLDQSRLKSAILKLPQKQRNLWLAMLKHSPPVPCSTAWNGSVTLNAVEQLCPDAALALVDDVRAEVEFKISASEDETAVCPSEGQKLVVCRLQSGRHVSVVEDALTLSQRNIEAGTDYQTIWDYRFRSIASAPSPSLKKVTIVDRYAIEQHFRCPQDRLSGLNRFLKQLDLDAGGQRHVTVFAAWTEELRDRSVEDVRAEMEKLMHRLPAGKVRRLMVYMIPNFDFGLKAHDRFVRFDRYVWELGRGLEVFEGPAARHLCQASFKISDGTHRGVESELEGRAKPKPTPIKIRR